MKLGLRARLLLPILLAILVGMGLSAITHYHSFTTSLAQIVKTEMRNDVGVSASHVDGWVRDRMHDMEAWADDRTFVVALRQSNPADARPEARAADALKELRSEYPYYDNLGLVDTSGRVLLAAREGDMHGKDLSNHTEFSRALAGHTTLSDAHTHTTARDKQAIVAITAPVRDKETGRVVGVLLGVVSLEAISDLFVKEPNPSTQAMILGTNGTVIADARKKRILNTGPEDNDSIRRILASRSDTVEYAENGDRWIAAHAPIPVAGWTFVRVRSLDQAYAPGRAMGMQFVGILFVVILTVALIVIASVNGVTRAVRLITRDAREVATGNLDVDIEVIRNDEIGELADILRTVVDSFRETAMICQNVAEGDFNHTARVRGPHDRLGRAINQMATMLREAVGQADAVAHGKYETRIEPRSDRDALRRALRDMTERLRSVSQANERQVWIKTGLTDLNDIMRDQQRVEPLLNDTIERLARYVGASIGAVYTTESDNELRRAAAYAGGPIANMPDRIAFGEGLVGQAARDRTSRLIDDVPPNYIKAVSGLGEATPTNIVIVPLVHRDELKGVLELASLQEFSEAALEMLDEVAEDIAIAIHAVHSHEQLHELLERSQAQSEELQVQQEELRQANDELEARARALSESEQMLQAQQEELREANEELRRRTRELEGKDEAPDR